MHVYIVNEFADGVDECQRIDLEADQLRKIANALRNNELPKNDDCHGFFFGGEEWWDELRSEGKEHAKLFDKAADWVDETHGVALLIRRVGREVDMINKDSIKAYNKFYKPLKGAKIVDFNMVKCEFDPDSYCPTFTMQQGTDRFNLVLSG